MVLAAAGRTPPDPPGPPDPPARTAAASEARPSLVARLRRPRALLALVLLAPIGAGLVVFTGLAATSEPIAPLGAAAAFPGGVARVNGIIPLESDGWLPSDAPAALAEPPAEGAHRVRILLELTALTEDGVAFSADDYTILGLGSGRVPVLWSAPDAHTARQGEVISATLVFEIPDRAVELTLVGEDGGRLALGVGHHTGDR